ncbi:amidophosphoribosyltransferase-like [Cimex lectularius]|uniref:Glutamine amidotransferase type-2 domain-containing protein n=1 Tax=Cimex lectularius TaxID=79782 RepID=A0A8I6SMC6_CIMLE|nr:amidophosphoribosyltransferase-like [Cimex lectularius]
MEEIRKEDLTGMHHECGVFGCLAGRPWPTQLDIGQIICLGLVALQHRGQESAGIVTSEGKCSTGLNVKKGMGMINTIFNDESMKKLKERSCCCKNRYVGRTFIQPSTRLRQLGVAKKFGALSENVENKRIILIDDSIVRGNTIGPIIKLLRDAEAKEVHIRIASPPLRYPCFMGINIPTIKELIADKLKSTKLAEHVSADSLMYLSVEGLRTAVRCQIKEKDPDKIGHCTACLTGEYPVPLEW